MRKIGTVALLLLLVVGVAAFFLTDTRQQRVWKGDVNLDFTKGRFYGAGRVLEAYGHDDVRVRKMIDGLEQLNGRGHLLVVDNVHGEHNATDATAARELLDWVERGNHLVLAVADVPNEGDLRGTVLSRVGVAAEQIPLLHEHGKQSDGKEPLQAYAPNLPDCMAFARRAREAAALSDKVQPVGEQDEDVVRCTHELNRLSWPQDGREWLLRVPFPRVRFVPQEDADVYFASRSPSGSGFVRVGFGEGSITLVEETVWLGNPNLSGMSDIKTHHHADLLVYLADGTQTVWLVETLKWQPKSLPAPTWWELLRDRTVPTVLVLAAVSVFIWRQAARVGLVRILPPAPERYLNRHFLAQGQFLLRHLNKTAVLNRLQRDLLEELHRRHPAWGRLTVQQQLDWLCGQTRLPSSLIRPWLAPLPDKLSGVRWIELLQGHRRIVQALKRGAHG